MLADDLLQQAHHLATLDLRKPKQANLRRAVSAAYYALFHLLVAAAVQRISPKMPSGLSARISRAFTHAEMKQVCKSIIAGNPSEALRELQPGGFSPRIKLIAEEFVELQEARHLADYDPSTTFNRARTLAMLLLLDRAFEEWRTIQAAEEANVFLAALQFAGRVVEVSAQRHASMQGGGLLLKVQRGALLSLKAFGDRFSRKRPLPQHLRVGLRGEFEALFFLRRQGFVVVERRWRSPELNGDLDLIAWEGETLCFVEVKTRSARDMTPAALAVNPAKRNMLRRMSASYRRTLPQAYRDGVVRFDIVSVYLLDQRVECELVRDIDVGR